MEYTINGGERWHSARAYLYPAARRPNLHVLTQATVRRVSNWCVKCCVFTLGDNVILKNGWQKNIVKPKEHISLFKMIVGDDEDI